MTLEGWPGHVHTLGLVVECMLSMSEAWLPSQHQKTKKQNKGIYPIDEVYPSVGLSFYVCKMGVNPPPLGCLCCFISLNPFGTHAHPLPCPWVLSPPPPSF